MPDRVNTHTPVVAGLVDKKVMRENTHGTFQ
jgi:hypothetical protein